LSSKVKNAFSIILILILLINSGVYVLLYLSSIKIVKKTVHYLLSKNQLDEKLVLIAISKKDVSEKKIKFEWVEEREFRLNGNMYDVKEDKSDADSLKFLCYLDDHENLLEQLFNSHTDTKKNSDSNHQKLVLIPFLFLYYQENHNLVKDTEVNFFSENKNYKPINTCIDVLTPPPQCESTLC
jgi:hypothetical protein